VIPNAFDASNLWSDADYDRPHVLVINAVYELPIFRDRARWTGKLLGGWTVSAVSQWQSGTPFSIATGDDFAGVGPGSGAQFWIVNGKSDTPKKYAANNSDPNFFFTTTNGSQAIYTAPANGTINTNSVRNILRGPNVNSHNLGFFKDFYITETQRITFRAEAFNWLNHPNWNGPDTNPRSATFGKVVSKGQFAVERQLQFAIRYQF
jgi:hypothetical protein